jgi:DNA-binding Lrp family transcriptional regulator
MISTRQANKLREGHIRVFDSVMLELSRLNLTGQDHRVLWILLGTMEFENLIIINQTVIAGMLGIHRSAISRSITRLKAADILRQCGKIGVLDKYMVSPYLAIKSRNSKIGQVVDMWEDLPQVDQKLRLV